MNFLEKLEKLRYQVPRLANINVGSENSDYCTHSDKNKNCYLLFAANFNEDCYYGSIVLDSRDCADCSNCSESELCFECIDILKCYNCNYSTELTNCNDCHFCYDCIGCQDCFGSVGLRQKKYYYFNEKLAREEYEKRIKEFDWKDTKQIKKALVTAKEVGLKIPRVYSKQMKTVNCVGDHISNSKNVYFAFDANYVEDSLYLFECWRTKDSMDLHFSDGTELCYECFSVGITSYNCNFCSYIRGSSDCEYCELCFSCKNCFGCVGVQNKEYHILNEPYTPEEYRKKVMEIKEEMRSLGIYGKFLPTTYRLEDTAGGG